MFFEFGPTINMNVSPVVFVWVVPTLWVKEILEGSLNVSVYSIPTPIPASTVEVKLLLASPLTVAVPLGVVVVVINVLSVELSAKFKIGWLVSVKSKITSPRDSSQFAIPSLSKSRSTLSIQSVLRFLLIYNFQVE